MRTPCLFAILGSFSLWAAPATAQSCGCEVTDAKEQQYDSALRLPASEFKAIDAIHLPYGIPTKPTGATHERALHQRDYVINYDGDLRVPTWVAYRLTAEDVAAERKRTECFRRDVRVSDGEAAFCADYDEPIFDQGHLVPNADMKRSEEAMINTYMFTNMAPQHDKLNRVIWARLEGYVRKWAAARGTIHVLTGAGFDRDDDGERDSDDAAERVGPTSRVAIPTAFFKIVLHERPDGFIESMTFVLPHVDSSPTGKKDSDEYLVDHLTTIDEVEKLTGVNFFRSLPTAKENAVEAFRATELWPLQ